MKYIHPSSFLRPFCAKIGLPGTRLWHFIHYWQLRGHAPNFRHPKDLSELILSAMNKKSFSDYSVYADKVNVREYIKSKGLERLLLNVFGVWEDANDIDFDALPDKFALKPNNGSGGHVFCHDKSKLNIPEAIKQLNQALVHTNPSYAFEGQYAKIPPRIYCEELMETGNGINPTDYKFTCIKGQIGDIFIAQEDENMKRKYATVDTNWQILPYTKPEFLLNPIPEKPKHLEEMIEIAKMLSADFDIVRVDLYEYKDKVYFSELTFSPWGGYMYSYTDEGLIELGKLYYKK